MAERHGKEPLIPMSRKSDTPDVFADLRAPRLPASAHRPYAGPDVGLIKRWLDGEDLPRKSRISKLRAFSVQLRSYALDHPDEAIDAIIASVEFKIYELMHNRKSESEQNPRDPFSGDVIERQKGAKQS
jgi:hypothetical protein